YAIRIVRRSEQFNLCPADICSEASQPGSDRGWAGSSGRVEALPVNPLEACPVSAPAIDVSGYDAPPEAIETAIRLTRGASIDVGGVEYLVGNDDGRIYFYDVNATSNFVA